MRQMFSKKQVETIVNDTLTDNIGEAIDDYFDENPLDLSSVDVEAKTLSQTNANYSKAIYLSGGTYLSVENIYNRFEVINNVLYIIISSKLTNSDSSSHTYTTLGYTSLQIDSTIAGKIYDLEGNTVATAEATANCVICQVPAIAKKSVNGATTSDEYHVYMTFDNRAEANTCRFSILSTTSISLDAGESIYVMGRMALTLI